MDMDTSSVVRWKNGDGIQGFRPSSLEGRGEPGTSVSLIVQTNHVRHRGETTPDQRPRLSLGYIRAERPIPAHL